MFDKDNVRNTLAVLKAKVKEDFDFNLADSEMLLHLEKAQIERRNEYIARQLKCIPSDGLRFLIEELKPPKVEVSLSEETPVLKKITYGRKKKLAYQK